MLNPPDGITAGPITEDNILEWESVIVGPEQTAYEGGLFTSIITFPKGL